MLKKKAFWICPYWTVHSHIFQSSDLHDSSCIVPVVICITGQVAISHVWWLLHLQSVEMKSGVKATRRIGSLVSGMRLHVYSRGEGLVQLVKYALFLITQQLHPGKPLKTHTPIFRQCASKADNSNSVSHWLILTNKISCRLQWLSYMHFLWTVEILEINYSMFFLKEMKQLKMLHFL